MQDGIKDCGVCSLLSVVRYYNGNISKEYLRELTNTNKNGVSASKLVEAAKFLGFNSYGLYGNITDIKKDDLPIIAHIILNKTYKHFIVIYDIDHVNNKLIVMDPAKGKRVMKFSEFNLLSSKHFIYLKPVKQIAFFSSKETIKKTILNFFKKNLSILNFLLTLSFSCFILNVLSAFHFKYLMDHALNFNSIENALYISLSVLTIFFLKEVTSSFRNVILLKWSCLFDEMLTMKTFRQIISLPYLYYKNRTTGEVVSRIRDLSQTKNFLANVFCFFSTDFLCIIIFIILLLYLNKNITLIVLGIIALLLIISIVVKNYLKKLTIKFHKNEVNVNSYLIEVLSSNSVVKSQHIENDVIYKFRKKYKALLSSVYKLSFVGEVEVFLKNIIINTGLVIILFLGSKYIILEKMTLSELIVFQSVLNYYFSSFKNFISLLYDFQNFKISLERVEDLFSIKKEEFIGSRHYEKYNLKGLIKYKDLTYAYNSKKLLDKVNLEIRNGERVFLYGETGSGKSTLMKLLIRYIDVPFGSVSIKGIDINHYHLDLLRNKICYVSQSEYLFTDTIIDNITLGRAIDDNKYKKVCDITKVNEIIKNSEGGDKALIEENGFNFSGGERQRIILARSLLKQSDIYIFDEALSQVDSKKELEILEKIFTYLKGKTIIFISHRLKNKNIFDRCICLKNGKCYEEEL